MDARSRVHFRRTTRSGEKRLGVKLQEEEEEVVGSSAGPRASRSRCCVSGQERRVMFSSSSPSCPCCFDQGSGPRNDRGLVSHTGAHSRGEHGTHEPPRQQLVAVALVEEGRS